MQKDPDQTGGPRPSQRASSDGSSAALSGTAADPQGQRKLVPTLSLPKGGGAIRGIGEKFSTNPVTGTGSLSVPIATSGRTGFELGLALRYDSGAGNGPHGIGWQYSTPSITRKTDKGLPRYADDEESDVFVLSGAEDLVPVRVKDGEGTKIEVIQEGEYLVRRYRPRTEGYFARIERWTHKVNLEIHWRVTTSENVLNVYGQSREARIADPEHPDRIFSWLLEETRDDRGNVARYIYKSEDDAGVDPGDASESNRFEERADETLMLRATAQRYVKRIQYGNRVPLVDRGAPAPRAPDAYLFEVVFDYGEHDDAAPTPAETRPWLVRKDPFSTYRATFEIRTYRLCRRVLTFHRFSELGEAPCLVRSTDFAYDEGASTTYLAAITQAGYKRDPDTGTYERATLPPLDLGYTRPILHDDLRTVDRESLEGISAGVEGASAQWVDLDGEGIPGVLIHTERAWFYKSNFGEGHLGAPTLLRSLPSAADLRGGVQQLTDLGGDGNLDLVQYAPALSGYFEWTPEAGFTPFVALKSVPNINWNDPNLRFLDLDGDGLPDVLITEHEAFLWYRSRGKDGFEPGARVSKPKDEQKGAAIVFADGAETIQLADMSGDGLVDIVRVRDGEVCYWPNLGYGRFGRKVTLSRSPRFDHADQFDPRRVRFADIDGSGTSDLLYLGRDGIRIYFNEAGNGLSMAERIESLPAVDSLSYLSIVDLLGQGTACLVWSSPGPANQTRPLLYIDLMNGKKPHVLESIVNNLGAETRLAYAPSTRFYLKDKADGRPWLTRLAFPVHVVERAEYVDHVAKTKLVTSFAYHHGFFDGYEREFRGFACVEQWDAESFSTDHGKGLFPEVDFEHEGTEELLDVPPVRTVTWFHTGAWLERERLELALAKEYYGRDPGAPLLADTRLPEGLSVHEEREAARALRGQILRQEVYAEDGKPESIHPYSVFERDYELRLLQHSDAKSHAVFYVHPRHRITLHYERSPSDPRMQHEIVLEIDPFGNVTQAAAIGYPRRVPTEPEQARLWVTVTENTYANVESGGRRLGVPLETRSYELTGLAAPAKGVLSFEEVRMAARKAKVLSYEERPTSGFEKRLVEHTRSRYYDSENLPNPLPFGKADTRAIPYESYRLALTPGLLEQAFNGEVGRVTDAVLHEGGYVHLDGDRNWWAPAGRAVPDPSRFFLPTEFIDPFGNVATVAYDEHALLIERVEDAAHNVVRAQNNYRVLGPAMITDPNGNRIAVKFDALGLVVATAVMGKEGSSDGDTLDDPTTVLEYDLFRWKDSGGKLPSLVHTKAREQHGLANTRWQETYTYSDGSGRVAMAKLRAEPGEAPLRGADGKLLKDAHGELVLGFTEERWVGSGKTVVNNKGNPVKQYEPFFSSTPEFEDEDELVRWGVTPVLFYDPPGRLIRTTLPHGGLRRVSFTPWEQTAFDENDTVSDLGNAWFATRRANAASEPSPEEQRAARLTFAHRETPTTTKLDALGRPFLVLDRLAPTTMLATRTELDIEGQALSITDALDRVCMRYVYGIDGQVLRESSIDAGERRRLSDVAGAPLRAWDAVGHRVRQTYDALRRPTHVHVQKGAEDEQLATRIIYGESYTNPEEQNLRGRAVLTFDGAGLLRTESFDFKGNLLSSMRTLARAYQEEPDWSPLGALEVPGAALGGAEALLGAESFSKSFAYDALNRLTSATAPDDSKVVPTYNEVGLLERLDVHVRGADQPARFILNIDYNAKGQRERIAYSNGTTTAYTYDPLTFRLTRLKTTRASDGVVLQNLFYTYDCVGNVVAVEDTAQQTVFFGGAFVEPSSAYEYDALYRLTRANGREHRGHGGEIQRDQNDMPLQQLPHPNDIQALRRYEERFVYDGVGNILEFIHDKLGAPGSWTRRYRYGGGAGDGQSNRLHSTSLPGDAATRPYAAKYVHDANGNMVAMPHLAAVAYTHTDRMRRADLGGGGTAFYTYDGSGERVRKVVERIGTLVEERIYLGGYEVYRKRDQSGVLLERQTLHVMDDMRRVAMVETKTVDVKEPAGRGAPRIRFQYTNQLDSALLECDEDGLAITYEEYHPYGTTAYWSARSGVEVSAKRYRYTGKERDEETGLYYHGARYYAPWLGRWTSADPAGFVDGLNLFVYVRNRPTALTDPNGQGAWDHILGGVKAVGGALETAAGIGLIGVGAATAEFGVGVLIIAAGVAVTAHGADTTIAGARQAISGEQTDTLTSTGLQRAGVSRRSANLADAGISIVGTFGAGALTRTAPAAAEGLVHLTTAESAAAITTTQTLGRGGTIYAGSASLAEASGTGLFLRTGLLPSQATTAITVPQAAASAFRVPTVIGPATAWQRLSGTVYTAGAGSIDLTTGVFTRLGPATNQLFFYGFDATVVAIAKTGPELGSLAVDILVPGSTQSSAVTSLEDAPLAFVLPGSPESNNGAAPLPFAFPGPAISSIDTSALAPAVVAPTPAEEEAQQSLLPEFR
ncbi:toxin [Sorangium cellulosum]|uniref:Toxin n=1 Tax=Sorangium cellulosum TaxID=56 RepID=A0A2L0EWI0_SORCE|nr:SpvB/TcaC N-terminal domain-containing protein [Sorangium cellulosum]AUX43625.1 toxin [Sorangium cellulosum]